MNIIFEICNICGSVCAMATAEPAQVFSCVWMKTHDILLRNVSNHSSSQLHRDVWTAKLFFFVFFFSYCAVHQACAPPMCSTLHCSCSRRERKKRGKAMYIKARGVNFIATLRFHSQLTNSCPAPLWLLWEGFTLYWLWSWWSWCLVTLIAL